MFLLKSFSSSSSPAPAPIVLQPQTTERRSFWPWYRKPEDSKKIELSKHSQKNYHRPIDKILSMTDSDDFVDIQYRKLSYAEVASLSLNNQDLINLNPNSSQSKTILIDTSKDLDRSVTDYQLLETYVKNKSTLNSSSFRNDILEEELGGSDQGITELDFDNLDANIPEKIKSNSIYKNHISSKINNKMNNLNKKAIKKAKKKANQKDW